MSRWSVLRRFLRWARAQLHFLLSLAVWALGGALVAAIARRRLRTRALCAALATLLVGLCLTGLGEAARWRLAAGSSWPSPWLVGLVPAFAAGTQAAKRARDVCVLELQASWLCAGGALYALLQTSAARLSGHRVSPWSPCLGEVVAGPLWDRALGLFVLGGAALSLWGASCQLTFGRAPGEARLLPPWRWHVEWHLLRQRLGGRDGAWLSPTTSIATLGVALGVAALITVTAVMSGYQHDIQERILNTNAHVVVQKYGTDFTEVDAAQRALLAVPGVEAVAPFAFNEALLASAGKSFGILVKGVTEQSTAVTGIAQQVCDDVEGQGAQARCVRRPKSDAERPQSSRLLSSDTGLVRQRGLLIGLSLFRALNVPLGTSVQVMTPASLVAGRHTAPRRERFVVRGVFDSGMHEFDSHLAYVALPAAQQLLGLGEAVSGIEVRLKEPLRAEAMATRLLEAMGHYPYRALDWRALNGSIFTAIALQKIAMFILLSFIVVVASFNIASTLMMAAMQRAKDVAILKSLGITQTSVLRLFVFEGLAIATCGCVLGLVLGIGITGVLSTLDLSIAADVYMVGALRVRLEAREVAGIVTLAFAICQVASLVPALRAAQESPMQMFAEAV